MKKLKSKTNSPHPHHPTSNPLIYTLDNAKGEKQMLGGALDEGTSTFRTGLTLSSFCEHDRRPRSF